VKVLSTLFGSWPRIFLTIYVTTHAAVLLGLTILFFVVVPQTMFRFDAITDTFRVEVRAGPNLSWGPTEIIPLGGGHLECPAPEVDLPPNTIIIGDRDRAGAYSLTASFEALSAQQRAGLLRCPDGRRWPAPLTITVIPNRDAKRAAVFRVSGAVTVGGDVLWGVDPLQVDILHSGRVIAETVSFPFGSGRVRVEKDLLPGDKLSILETTGRTDAEPSRASASGIVLLRSEELRIVGSATGTSAEISRPGLSAPVVLAFAPSIWERFQAQSGYGFLALVLLITLNLSAAFKEHLFASAEAKQLFQWSR